MSSENLAAARSQKIWAVLLVLDSFLVIIFGGALAAKVYQHWQTPAPAPIVHKKARTPKPVEPPKVESAAAPAPEPKPTETPPAKKTSNAITPPKPSLISEAPRRQSAQPQELEAVKAIPVEFKLRSPRAKAVEIGGAFLVRGGGRKRMVKNGDDVWKTTLYLTPNTYRYYFWVDGKKTLDPKNENTDRSASVIAVSP
ncbi:MAG: hypothetical protein A3J74_03520 [Elusimicrobia bacterium RIFCSPHIGHO2_02_FULL_57_9]|nr:MAG: hypothetical protein A3J74_03520 [Elusimicrobia bacterium RIFCSPHIGHO2_02_FULL_57_9]